MTFNDLKFEMLRFGPDTTLKICTNYTSPEGAIINIKDHVKDLGVTVSADGTFKEYINKTCQSAKTCVLGFYVHSSTEVLICCSQRGSPLSFLFSTIAPNFGAHRGRGISNKSRKYKNPSPAKYLYQAERITGTDLVPFASTPSKDDASGTVLHIYGRYWRTLADSASSRQSPELPQQA